MVRNGEYKAMDGNAVQKKRRSSGGAKSIQGAYRELNNWSKAVTGIGIVMAVLVVAAVIMAGFGAAAFHRQKQYVKPDVKEIKHQILNARTIADRNAYTDDDDDGFDDDDDDDDDGDDDEDWAVFDVIHGGRTEFVHGLDGEDGHVNFDGTPITVFSADITVNGGEVTSECNNEIFEVTIAAGSPDIPVGAGVGAMGIDGWLGVNDFQNSVVVPSIQSSSLDEIRMDNTTSVMFYSGTTGLLSASIKTLGVAGTTTTSSPVVLDLTAYVFSTGCRFRAAPHGDMPNFFVVAWSTPDASGGINAMLVEITNYATPTFAVSPVVAVAGGNAATVNVLEYALDGHFVLGYSEATVGAQLITITADTLLNTVAFNAPVLLSAAIGPQCGVVSGGVRIGTGDEFVAVYGGFGNPVTAEVFSVSPVGVLASLAPSTIIYANFDATFKAVTLGTDQLALELIDVANNVFGILQVFTQTMGAINASPVATTIYRGHVGTLLAFGIYNTVEVSPTLERVDDSSVIISYHTVGGDFGFDLFLQVWDVVVDGASVAWVPGNAQLANEMAVVNAKVTVMTANRVIVSYGDIVNDPTAQDVFTTNAVVGEFDALNGRRTRVVQNGPTKLMGLARTGGVAGDTILVQASGCWTNSAIFDFDDTFDLCVHGDGSLRTNCFAVVGQEVTAYPRRIAQAISADTIRIRSPMTVDFP